MSRKRKNYPPGVVRDNCRKFLAALEKYLEHLQTAVNDKGEPTHIGAARRLWTKLDTYGRQLLAPGKAWKMSDWIATNPEWLPLERAGFFKGDAFEDKAEDKATSPGMEWGLDLERFLQWRKKTGKPLGYSGSEREDLDTCECVIEDVERDAKSLMARANELSAGRRPVKIRTPLTEREKAVFDVIPRCAEGAITEKEIIERLREFHDFKHGDLSTNILTKLREEYGVESRHGIGFCKP